MGSRALLSAGAMTRTALGLLGAAIVVWAFGGCDGGDKPQVVIPTGTPPAATLNEAQMVRAYDTAAQEHPEGIAVDEEGNIYASLARLGQVRKIAPDGTETVLLDLGGPKALGLAVDSTGAVYMCMVAPETDNHGVHRIDPDGTSQRLPGSEQIVHPNGLTLDRLGNLYVSDSEIGTLWRIPDGEPAELWLEHTLLEGTDELPGYPPIGANGLAHWQDRLYVANTEQNTLLRIPILEGGDAGEPVVVVELPSGPDGIAVDLYGRVYAAIGIQSKLVYVDPADSSVTELASRSDGLDIPASLAFGQREGESESLFLTNYAVTRYSTNAGVVRIDLGVEGYPLP